MPSQHEQILTYLRHASIATLTNLLFQRGYRDVFMAGLRVLHPDLRMAGIARTMRMVPDRPDLRIPPEERDRVPYRKLVDSLAKDDVAVVDAHGDSGGGVVGDIMTARMKALGAAGLVVDGAIRDAGQVTDLAFPVYTRHVHGGAISRTLISLETDTTIQCMGCTVIPGDYLAGDFDGVVVVPAAIAYDVAQLAAEHEEEETFIRQKVQAGAPLAEAYPMNAAVRAEYERWKAQGR
jgi:regulator of RNase E activity RraA